MNEVISQLVSAVGDQRAWVRSRACYALGEMGEKAGTNEVISQLVCALRNQSEEVRSSACSALGKIGEKAATDEVISQLLSALRDQSEKVRSSACDAVRKIIENRLTNEMISEFLNVDDQIELSIDESRDIVKGCLSSPKALEQIDPHLIKQIIFRFHESHGFENLSERDVICILRETENLDWLVVLRELALSNGTAVVSTEDKLIVYGKEESYELLIENCEFYEKLRKVFAEQAKPWYLDLKMGVEK